MPEDQLVLGVSVVVITALSVLVFGFPCAGRGQGRPGGLPEGPSARPFPRAGETVVYGEFANDGSLWRGRVYRFDGRAWTNAATCYPSTGKGCGANWSEVVYPPAASIAGHQLTQINSDRHGFLRGTHPKSEFEDAPDLWQRIAAIADSQSA